MKGYTYKTRKDKNTSSNYSIFLEIYKDGELVRGEFVKNKKEAEIAFNKYVLDEAERKTKGWAFIG